MRVLLSLAGFAMAFAAGWLVHASAYPPPDSPPTPSGSVAEHVAAEPVLEGAALHTPSDARAEPETAPQTSSGGVPVERDPTTSEGSAPGATSARGTSVGAAHTLIGQVGALLARGPGRHLELWDYLSELYDAEEEPLLAWLGSDALRHAGAGHVWANFQSSRADRIAEFLVRLYGDLARGAIALDAVSVEAVELLAMDMGAHLIGVLSPNAFVRFREDVRSLGRRADGPKPDADEAWVTTACTLLEAWARDASAAEASAALRDKTLCASEALSYLKAITDASSRAAHDPARILAAYLDARRRLQPVLRSLWTLLDDQGTMLDVDLARLDTSVLRSVGTMGHSDRGKHLWLYAGGTGRRAWHDAEPLIDQGLAGNAKMVIAMARALPYWAPDSAAKMRHLLSDARLPDHVKTMLREALAKVDGD